MISDEFEYRLRKYLKKKKNISQTKPNTSTIRFHLKGLQSATSVIKQDLTNQLSYP